MVVDEGWTDRCGPKTGRFAYDHCGHPLRSYDDRMTRRDAPVILLTGFKRNNGQSQPLRLEIELR